MQIFAIYILNLFVKFCDNLYCSFCNIVHKKKQQKKKTDTWKEKMTPIYPKTLFWRYNNFLKTSKMYVK